MTLPIADATLLLEALQFSAERHRDQRRKDRSASPYINHPIAVAHVLSTVGSVSDVTTLVAAILHDTIEDTQTTAEEIELKFGGEVRLVVEELTDDKSLPKEQRKRLQIQHAPHASNRAKLVKLADKICNIRDVTLTPPADWSIQRRREYLDWTEHVVAGCRGCNEALERYFDQLLQAGRSVLGAESS